MRLKRPYIISFVIIIVTFLFLWIKSHETKVLPDPDLDELDKEEKEIQLSSINGQRRVTLITFQNYKLKFGHLDLAQQLKQEVSQLTLARDTTYKNILLQHIIVLEQLEKDTLFHENEGFYEYFDKKDLYSVLQSQHIYKLLLKGKAEVAYRDKLVKPNKIKAIVRKFGNTDADVTFLTQKQDTIYIVVLITDE